MKENIEIKNLDHLGLVAGIIDELEIEKIIDKEIEKDSREKISAGKIVKAIILNGLGFVSKPLYLFPEFYRDKPVEHLLGKGIKAEEINDDKIGRVMDKIYQYGLSKFWLEIGIKTVSKYKINTKFTHLDSSSISVHGEYKTKEEKEEKKKEEKIEITYGYSKDKRPDLKQFMIDLIMSSDGDIPLFGRVDSGNESDKVVFGEIIEKYKKEINYETIYVADSALYTANNLHKLGNTKWLSRVPLNIKKAKTIISELEEKDLKESKIKGYEYKEKKVNYHGIEQRWLIVFSEKRKQSDLTKIEKRIKKEKEKIENQLKKWKKAPQELVERKIEVKNFVRQLKYNEIAEINYLKTEKKTKKELYICQGLIKEKESIIAEEKKKAGKFILATNILDKEELSSEEMLSEYKKQQSCERGFRFLKNPLFLADSVYIKTETRIETMTMLMGLCLLVYGIGQRIIRNELKTQEKQVRNQLGKLTNKPTMRWIFQCLQGIHLVTIKSSKMISNLTKEIREIIEYFSETCRQYYLSNDS